MTVQDKGHEDQDNPPPASTPPLRAKETPDSLGESERVVSVHTEDDRVGSGSGHTESRLGDVQGIDRGMTVGDDEARLCSCSGVVYPMTESEIAGTRVWNQAEVEGFREVPFGVRWLVKFFSSGNDPWDKSLVGK